MTKDLKELEIEELYYLSANIDKDPDTVAGMLFPDNPPDREGLVKKIGQWAITQTTILENARDNRHDVAFIYHKVNERLWYQLPSYAQRVKINMLQMKAIGVDATF